jgi:serine/threonine protein kinase/tetratricopeptide (TPR) repeat protein
MIGQILGHYRIVEKIGEGGMGVVYRAHDERLDRDVALKLLPAGLLANSTAVKSFREEAQALSKLNHPNIATIHDFDAQDGLNFLVMEYVHGSTLLRRITAAGPLPEKEIIRLGTQLAQGLQAAHSKGVIHRDLKPSNLAVTTDSRLKILDFGLARFSATADRDVTQTSVDVNPPGTLAYMAPELLQGQPADERSDIYAVGAVLYEMTTGQRLFPDKQGSRLLDAILHRSVTPPRNINNRVSRDLQEVIQKALDKDPDRRYQSAKEMRVDLQRLPVSLHDVQPLTDGEPTGPLPLEIAHILFMDIIAYSQFPMEMQKQFVEELQRTVRSTSDFSRAKARNNLISLPSGDGMALVFFNDLESPCRCALEVSRLLRNHPDLKLRMGIHTGLVSRTADINANRNVTGGGINTAQRVMDCGDAGHILVSEVVADMLADVTSWKGHLHDLGEAEVKHEKRIHLYNLYTEDAGNPKLPKKLTVKKFANKSNPGTTPRPASKRRQSEKAAEFNERALVAESKDTKPAHTGPKLFKQIQTAIGKRPRLVALAFVILAVGSFAVTLLVPHKTKAAPPGVPPLIDGKYLAIMPFVAEGDTAALIPLAESLNQQLSTKLLGVRELQWVASTRAAEEVDQSASLEAIGGKLGANLVVVGTVRNGTIGPGVLSIDNAKKIEIRVELHEVYTGRLRMSRKFSGAKSDLLILQDQIYSQLLRALEITPTNDELEKAAARPTDSPEAFELYYAGRNLYRGHPDSKQVSNAIALYNQAIQKDPNFALAYASLADASVRMYRETQDVSWIQKATEEAQRAEKLDANLREAHLSLGNIYRVTGKTDEAIEELKRAIAISPRADDSYRRLGQVYEDVGNKSQALTSFNNAVTLNSYYWNNFNELGNAYTHFGEHEKALAAFRRVLELDPANPIGHENIGAIYFFQAKYNEALPEFKRAIDLQSTNADIYSDMGEALLYLKRYDEALQYLEKAAQMQPNDQAIVGNLADGYRLTGKQNKSIETYDRAISLANKELNVNPKDATALGCLGVYYAKKGESVLAQHYIRRARAIDSSDMQLAYAEAVIRVLARQPELAIKSLRDALEKGVSPEQANLDPEFSEYQNNPAFRKLLDEYFEKQKRTT